MDKFDIITADIDAVIFDMDGTIIDSMHVWRDIDIEYFDENNIKYNVILPRINDIFKNVEEMVLTINEYMEDYIEKNPDIID